LSAKARILVVDDERSMQEFLEIFFRSGPASICCMPRVTSRRKPWSS
jgi:DNA-binding response OmpR family regulator